MVEVLKRLTEARGVAGNEDEVREIILELAAQTGAEVSVDRMGNVIARKPGLKTGKKVMLAAHMDEVGFIISYITDSGMLKFHTVGGIDQRLLLSKRVRIGKKGIPGVMGVKAIHLQEKDERNKVIDQKQMVIDIGVHSKEEAQKLVELGDYACFDSNLVVFGDNKVKAKALDDRVGCAVLLELLKDTYDFDLIACLWCRRKSIPRRSGCLAPSRIWELFWRVLPADIPDVPEHMHITKMGRGPAISYMDRSSIADPELFRQMVKTAREHSIPYQLKKILRAAMTPG